MDPIANAACKAAGLPICEPEEEKQIEEIVRFREIEQPKPVKALLCDCVFRHEAEAEEEQEPENVDQEEDEEELLLEDIRAELEQKTARVDHIGLKLSLHTPDCPIGNECVDMQQELDKFGVHPEILELQRDNSKLRQQLDSLQLSCTAADLSLKQLRKDLCRDLEAAVAVRRRLDILDSFKRNAEREQALCRQRYNHLLQDKFEWVDCQAYIKHKQVEASLQLEKFVPRKEYTQPKRDVIQVLNRTKLQAKELHDFLTENMTRLSLRLGLRASTRLCSELGDGLRLSPEIAAFLHRNEQLFATETTH